MFYISRGLISSEEDAQGCLGLGLWRLQCGGVFLPLLAADFDLHGGKTLILAHAGIIHETHLECGLASLRTTSPERETITASLHDSHAEESLVLETSELVAVARVTQTHIVGITLEGTIIAHIDLAKGTPAHKTLGELKRAVLHHLGIKTTIGSVVDILEEDSVHRGLYRGPNLLGVHVHDVGLGRSSQSDGQQQQSSQFSHIYNNV